MTLRIRVVETNTIIYEPDLNSEWYVDYGATNIGAAMGVDRKDYNDGKVTLEELSKEEVEKTTRWELIDADGNVVSVAAG